MHVQGEKMKNRLFSIITDSACDMPKAYYTENEVEVVPLGFTMDNVNYEGESGEQILEKDFYANLTTIRQKAGDRAILRAIHYFDENKRVNSLVNALNNNDYDAFLTAIKESGDSSYKLLQNCYVAGSKDQSVPITLALAAKYLNGGVNRIHGGGFAGTILNVVKNENVQAFIDGLSAFYDKKAIIPLKVRKLGTTVL